MMKLAENFIGAFNDRLIVGKHSFRYAVLCAALAGLVRFLTETYLGHKGLFNFETTSITVCVFVQAMVLSGVLQDYKECERLPSMLAMQLEGLWSAIQVALRHSKSMKGSPSDQLKAMRLVLGLVDSHLRVFVRASERACIPEYLDRVQQDAFSLIDLLKQHDLQRESGELLGDVSKLRPGAARVATMSQTSFLPSAYLLYDSMVVSVLVVLQLATFSSRATQFCYVPLLTFIFMYMSLLIRDADSPTEYERFKDVPTLVAAHGGRLLPLELSEMESSHPASSPRHKVMHNHQGWTVGGLSHRASLPDQFGDEVPLWPLIHVRDRIVAEITLQQGRVTAQGLASPAISRQASPKHGAILSPAGGKPVMILTLDAPAGEETSGGRRQSISLVIQGMAGPVTQVTDENGGVSEASSVPLGPTGEFTLRLEPTFIQVAEASGNNNSNSNNTSDRNDTYGEARDRDRDYALDSMAMGTAYMAPMLG